MISCTAEARETQPCSTGGWRGFSFVIWTTHTDGEPQSRGSGLAVPFHREGGIHHDQCILVDDMNHVAGEGAQGGGGNICRCACVIVDKLNHGVRVPEPETPNLGGDS